jgi:hypothetical protein
VLLLALVKATSTHVLAYLGQDGNIHVVHRLDQLRPNLTVPGGPNINGFFGIQEEINEFGGNMEQVTDAFLAPITVQNVPSAGDVEAAMADIAPSDSSKPAGHIRRGYSLCRPRTATVCGTNPPPHGDWDNRSHRIFFGIWPNMSWTIPFALGTAWLLSIGAVWQWPGALVRSIRFGTRRESLPSAASTPHWGIAIKRSASRIYPNSWALPP